MQIYVVKRMQIFSIYIVKRTQAGSCMGKRGGAARVGVKGLGGAWEGMGGAWEGMGGAGGGEGRNWFKGGV
jgi:hypothetical protein